MGLRRMRIVPEGERVTGIGTIFAKAKAPDALYAWYERHLGFRRNSQTQAAVLESQRVLLNYRVDELDALTAALRAAGIEILSREDYDYGRFAWITDPEGNRIKLWEPAKG